MDSWNEWIWLLQFLIAFLCPRCREWGFRRYCDLSVPAAVGYRHAGCLQLGHVQTEDLSTDRCRSAASQTANGGAYRVAAPGAMITCWLLWATVNTVDLSHYTAVAVPMVCWAVFWFYRKWIQNSTESETDTSSFIHTCISDLILYAHWTMACGRLLLTMYWCHMQSYLVWIFIT